MIRANCHSDDHNVKVDFDATKWFQQASNEEILALARCKFGGDYPADDVAVWNAERNKKIALMFKYLVIIANDPAKKDCNGFECRINSVDAHKWLKKNRKLLLKKINRIIEDPASYDVRTGKFSNQA